MGTTKSTINTTHSEIGFKVKHLMFTNVSAIFETYEATITTEEDDFTKSSIKFSTDVASIIINNADRDNHLKSEDFFDADKNPKLTFSSSSSSLNKSENDYELMGELTLNGISKTVKLEAEISDLMKDPWGNTKIGLNIFGEINRKNWGLT
jgi:polyisoprenoid-binding protein YceI